MATFSSYTGYTNADLGISADPLVSETFDIATAAALNIVMQDNAGDTNIAGDTTNEASSDADQFVYVENGATTLVDGEQFYLETEFTFTIAGSATVYTAYHFESDTSNVNFTILPPGVPAGVATIQSVDSNPSPNSVDYSALSSGNEVISETTVSSLDLSGDDSIDGGTGEDKIDAGAGDDTIVGGAGDDAILGQDGADSVDGGDGDDRILGGDGDDTIDGGADDDLIRGGDGADSIIGGAGADTLTGGLGADEIEGGDGADLIYGDGEQDHRVTFNGTGTDGIADVGTTTDFPTTELTFEISLNGPTPLAGSTHTLVSYAVPGSYNEFTIFLSPSSINVWINNTSYNTGIPGTDLLDGTDHTLSVSLDTATGEINTYIDGALLDSGTHTGGSSALDSGGYLVFAQDQDSLGGSYDGTQALKADFMEARLWSDVRTQGEIALNSGVPLAAGETDLVSNWVPADDETGLDDLTGSNDATYGGDVAINAADPSDDTLEGGDGNDTIFGNDGDDRIDGGADDDELHGGEGDDALVGDAGNDAIFGDEGDDRILGGAGDDDIEGGDDDDLVRGGAGADSIDGGDGNDTLSGGLGADEVLGGAGDDTIHGDGEQNNSVTFNATGNDGLADAGTINDFPTTELTFEITFSADIAGSPNTPLLSYATPTSNNEVLVFISSGTVWHFINGTNYNTGVPASALFDNTEHTLSFSLDTATGEINTYVDGELLDTGTHPNGTTALETGGNLVFGQEQDAPGGSFQTTQILEGDFFEARLWNDIRSPEEIAANVGVPLAAGETNLVSNWVPAEDLAGLEDIAGTHDAPFTGDVTTNAADTSDDTLDGGDGNDNLFGGEGDDSITVGVGDTTEGGDDADTFTLNFGQTSSDASTVVDIDGGTDGDDDDTLDLTGLGHFTLSETVDADSDSTSGTAVYVSGQTVNFAEIENLIVCFANGTQIKTQDGIRAVEALKVGDKLVTRDNGLQTIRWMGQRSLGAANLAAHPKLRPIRIKAGALGEGIPSRDLVVSPQHRIVVRSKIAIRMFDTQEVFVPAKHLLGLDGVSVAEDLDEVIYFHLLCDNHEIIEADGAFAETLYTGPEAMKALTPDALEEIATIFGEQSLSEIPLALLAPEGPQAKKLIARHIKNDQALYL